MKDLVTTAGKNRLLKKILLTMKLTTVFLMFGLVSVTASTYSQSTRLDINLKDGTMVELIQQIEKNSEFFFYYQKEELKELDQLNLEANNATIMDILDKALESSQFSYSVLDRYIVVRKKGDSFGEDMLSLAREAAIAQQRTVSGIVTDSNGQPLPGVTVMVKGTTQGTVTNSEGRFSISNISENISLVFSFIGMQTQEIVVGNQTSINVQMTEDTIGLEEVVAVGYGTLQRNKISSSIVSVSAERLVAQVTSSFDKSLEGQVSGLYVRQGSGAPGGGAELNIRGGGSIGSSGDPLVVIDGVPITGIFGKERSPLTLVNQSDIESLDVLKGVAATAIYGSRGSNGVILITTKSAKIGRTDFNFSSRFGVERAWPGSKLDLMNAEEFALWRKENAYERAAFYGNTITLDDIPLEYRYPEQLGEGHDWFDIMTQVAPMHEYNLSVSHGTETFSGFFSIGYLENEGTIRGTAFDRLSFLANMAYDPNDVITFGLSISPSVRKWQNQVGGSRTTYYGAAFMSTPLDGPYLDDGPWERNNPLYWSGKYDLDIYSAGTFSNFNALQAIEAITDESRNFNLRAYPYLVIKPLQGLALRSQFNVDYTFSTAEFFRPSTVTQIFNPPPLAAQGSYNTGNSFNWQLENTATYDKEIGNHQFNILAGYTRERYHSISSSLTGRQYASDLIRTINHSVEQTGNTSESNWSMISYLARLNYDYDLRYLLSATIRRDGSSRFGPDKRWGYFPSVSAGWNISREGFFPQMEWITNLKLRSSYGFSGNNSIGNYTWIPTLATNNYTFGGTVANGMRVAAMENRRLGWERAREFDTGVEMMLFGGRLNMIVDYYNRITEDMLWAVTLPISSGFTSVQDNIGEIQNKGVEFSVNSLNIKRPNFSWQTDFNISTNRNKVLSLGDVGRILTGPRTYSVTVEGEPMGMFYGWKNVGKMFDTWEEIEQYAAFPGQVPGTPRFVDLDNNGIIDQKDKAVIGNPWEDFRGGMINRVTYKNFDLSISMSFAHNFDVWAQLEEDVLNLDGVFNVLREVKERWRSPQEPGNGRIAASFHSTAFNRGETDMWVYNVSFLKVTNMNFGYTVRNLRFLKQLRASCSIQNPFIFTNYPYGNPDQNVSWE
jgi:TonB-dependent starch-binding outer membrane protein SusC